MTRSARLRYLFGALALALSLTACGGDDEPADESPPAAEDDSPSESTSGVLDFATVESLTAPRFTSDKNCPIGVWSENSTGVPDEFADAATFFRQFDCYKNEDQVAVGFPERGQQSIYVEFEDAATAEAYADYQSGPYWILVADTHVVVAGSGLKTVDMEAYVGDLEVACGCGELTAAEY